MTHDDDDPLLIRPDGQVERLGAARARHRPASYTPAVPRARRGLPSAPTDRRSRPRFADGAWRGRLIDVER